VTRWAARSNGRKPAEAAAQTLAASAKAGRLDGPMTALGAKKSQTGRVE
jgi:hypothetical protein